MTLGIAATISDAGISAPSFVDVLTKLQNAIKQIYGPDIYIDPDSKDGQLLAVFSQAVNDCNDMAVAAMSQFSPATATGAGLASVVKTNGIAKLVASNTTAVGTVVGQANRTIQNGVVQDPNGNKWNLSASVTIPAAGQIDVTVTAQDEGAIPGPVGVAATIVTPALGWQSFTFSAVDYSVPGAPVETDSQLRARQATSTQLPALTPLGALLGALENITGVQRVKLYENSTNAVDGNGVPAKSICAVIQGGNLATIAQTIGQKKTPGANTYGTTSQPYNDPVTGIPYTINFFVLATQTVQVKITGTAQTGYTSATGAAIQQAVSGYLSAFGIGEDVGFNGLWVPAYLNSAPHLQPYKLTSIQVSTDGGATWNTNDVVIAFNAIAGCLPANVTVNIV